MGLLFEEDKSACRQNRAIGDPILLEVQGIVGEIPAADIDGSVGEVLELDPIAAGGAGVARGLVDDHRFGIDSRIGSARRSAEQVAGTPTAAVTERVAWVLRRGELAGIRL